MSNPEVTPEPSDQLDLKINFSDHEVSQDEVFKSLELQNRKRSLTRQMSSLKHSAKPLVEILGEDAENIAKIRLFDAPQYFETAKEKQQIEEALKGVFQICKPLNRQDWLVYGLEPNQFENTTMNPTRRYNMINASREAENNNTVTKCFCFKRSKYDAHDH